MNIRRYDDEEGMRNYCSVLVYVQNHFGGVLGMNIEYDDDEGMRHYHHALSYSNLFRSSARSERR